MISSPVYRPLFALFFVALFVYVLRETYFEIRPMEERAALISAGSWHPEPGFGSGCFWPGASQHPCARGGDGIPEKSLRLEPAVVRRRAVSIVAWTLGFFLAIWLLGFVIAVPVASFLYFRFAGGEKWSISIPLSVAAGTIFYGLFDYFLHLPFPEGTLLAWLNLSG